MFEPDRSQAESITSLFSNSTETFVLSFLQGHMGMGWVDSKNNPACA